MLKLIPWYYRWLAVGLLVTAVAATGWLKGAGHVQAEWDQERAHLHDTALVIQAKQYVLTNQVVATYTVTRAAASQVAMANQKEVPDYVTQKADAGCTLSTGFVRVLNAAAAGDVLSAAPGSAVDAPSGVEPSAAAQNIAGNYATCRANAEALKALQGWAIKMQEVTPVE